VGEVKKCERLYILTCIYHFKNLFFENKSSTKDKSYSFFLMETTNPYKWKYFENICSMENASVSVISQRQTSTMQMTTEKCKYLRENDLFLERKD
jgi:hypothetical protein